jgi:hypothetical protein
MGKEEWEKKGENGRMEGVGKKEVNLRFVVGLSG